MNLTYTLLFLFITFAVILFKYRKKKKNPPNLFVEMNKIPLREGKKCYINLNRETPLECLENEGKVYGLDFPQKDIPQHSDKCECRYEKYPLTAQHIFYDSGFQKQRDTDIGSLNSKDFKYYLYSILLQKEFSPEKKAELGEQRDHLSPSKVFKKTVLEHLKTNC